MKFLLSNTKNIVLFFAIIFLLSLVFLSFSFLLEEPYIAFASAGGGSGGGSGGAGADSPEYDGCAANCNGTSGGGSNGSVNVAPQCNGDGTTRLDFTWSYSGGGCSNATFTFNGTPTTGLSCNSGTTRSNLSINTNYSYSVVWNTTICDPGCGPSPLETISGSVRTPICVVPPIVQTNTETNRTDNSARLNGETLGTTFGATDAWFQINTANGSCNSSFGVKTPDIPVGPHPNFYFQDTTLQPSTTYYFCAAAQSSAGTDYGSVRSFTTQAAPGYTLTVTKLGSGQGKITGGIDANNDGIADSTTISCGNLTSNDCSEVYPVGAKVVLKRDLQFGIWANWSGDCAANDDAFSYGDCALTMDQDRSAQGNFNLADHIIESPPTVSFPGPTIEVGETVTLETRIRNGGPDFGYAFTINPMITGFYGVKAGSATTYAGYPGAPQHTTWNTVSSAITPANPVGNVITRRVEWTPISGDEGDYQFWACADSSPLGTQNEENPATGESEESALSNCGIDGSGGGLTGTFTVFSGSGPRNLTIEKQGSAQGRIDIDSDNDGSYDDGSCTVFPCVIPFSFNNETHLKATHLSGIWAGWGGDCPSDGDTIDNECRKIMMNQDRTVIANFNLADYIIESPPTFSFPGPTFEVGELVTITTTIRNDGPDYAYASSSDPMITGIYGVKTGSATTYGGYPGAPRHTTWNTVGSAISLVVPVDGTFNRQITWTPRTDPTDEGVYEFWACADSRPGGRQDEENPAISGSEETALSNCGVDSEGNGSGLSEITVWPPGGPRTLTVNISGGGNGFINTPGESETYDGTAINCGTIDPKRNICTLDIPFGETASLTFNANSGGTSWTGWSGDCTGRTAPCVVTMDQDRTITTAFVRPDFEVQTSPTPSSGSILEGNSVAFSVPVHNTGPDDSAAIPFNPVPSREMRTTFYIENVGGSNPNPGYQGSDSYAYAVHGDTDQSIASGGQRLTQSGVWTAAAEGNYRVWACADAREEYVEVSESVSSNCHIATDGSNEFSVGPPGPQPPADLSITASPLLVNPNTPVTLDWVASNVLNDSCSVAGTNGFSQPSVVGVDSRTSPLGGVQTAPITGRTTFVLQCTNLDSEAVVTSVEVILKPQVIEIP